MNLNQITLDEMKNYLVSKSPKSDSFYVYEEGKITWGGKPEGSIRISDHWNFTAYGTVHCQLAEEDFEKYLAHVWNKKSARLVAQWRDGAYHVLEEQTAQYDAWVEEAERCAKLIENLDSVHYHMYQYDEVNEEAAKEAADALGLTLEEVKTYKGLYFYDEVEALTKATAEALRQDANAELDMHVMHPFSYEATYEVKDGELIVRFGLLELRETL